MTTETHGTHHQLITIVENLMKFQDETANRLNALIDHVNVLTEQVGNLNKFQHWCLEELDWPDDVPFVQFDPEVETQKPTLTLVK